MPERIILVTIDTLRADHLGLYGYPNNVSPFIDFLGEKSVVFDRAFASSNFTLPSHLSILTGVYPVVHGIIANFQIYSGKFQTMAEYYQSKGYKTARFVSTYFLETGRIKGFEKTGRNEKSREHSSYVVDDAIDWLETNIEKEDKLFIWIHLFDPHSPYKPDSSHLLKVEKQFSEDSELFEKYWFETQQKDEDILENYDRKNISPKIQPRYLSRLGDFANVSELMNLYDGEVLAADDNLKQIYDYFDNAHLNKNSMWIVTSDHGENLGNNGSIEHISSVYNSVVHVPLLVHFPDQPGLAARISEPVRHVDLFPTLVEFSGDSIADIIPIANGKSLKSVILNPDLASQLAGNVILAQQAGVSPEMLVRTDDKLEFAYKERGYSYFFTPDGNDRMYDDVNDFYQTENVISEYPKIASTMRDRARRMIQALRSVSSSSTISKDDRLLEELRDLGYIQ